MNQYSSGNGWRIIWKALSVSWGYRLFTRLIGGDAFREFYVRECIRPRVGERILDIGCGPGDILALLPPVAYIGFDLNPEYIRAARRRFGTRGEFIQQAVTSELIGQMTGFDLVMANGVLHHLDDGEALNLFHIALAALKPGGRLVSLDGVLTDGQSRVARYLILHDRGKFVRTEEQYVRLANSICSRVTTRIVDGRLRIPYTHIVMECQK